MLEPTLKPLGSGAEFKPQLLEMLQRSEFFGGLPIVEMEALAQCVQAYSVEASTVIFREGDRGGFMCLVLEGGAESFKQDHKFGSKRVGAIEPGKTVGEMALVDGEQRSATCICPQPSNLCCAPASDLCA